LVLFFISDLTLPLAPLMVLVSRTNGAHWSTVWLVMLKVMLFWSQSCKYKWYSKILVTSRTLQVSLSAICSGPSVIIPLLVLCMVTAGVLLQLPVFCFEHC